MINLDNKQIQKICDLYNDGDMEESSIKIRRKYLHDDGNVSVFEIFGLLDSLVILHDDNESKTRYVTFKKSDTANYLILRTDKSIEDLRFDAACMLRRVLRQLHEKQGPVSINCSVTDRGFTREDKHFACALLMPEKELIQFITQKDENGNYLYLNEKNEISFKNINVVADHFGLPFGKCSSRMFLVFEKLRNEKRGNFYLEGCTSKKAYKELRAKYSEKQMKKDRDEVCPNHERNSEERIKLLINALHYRPYDKLSDVAKRKILVNLIEYDAVNEKVVDTPQEVKDVIYQYIASGGKVDKNGVMHTGDKTLTLSDDQLIVIGEYDLSEKVLKDNLITNMMKYDPTLSRLKGLSYKDAINALTERDICYFIKSLHRDLYKRLEEKYEEKRGGEYRNYPVYLPMTGVAPIEWTQINYEMQNLAYRILTVLKDNVNGQLSNCEYIERVNQEIYNMIRMQPFQDGNKRTSKLLSNILYQEKGIPYILVSQENYGAFVDGWRSHNTDCYNKMMYSLILDSYSYFYGNQSVNEVVNARSKSEKIINANRKKKR